MQQVIMMKDIVEANGKTIYQNNMEQTHKIPLDTLVEVNCDYHASHGVRGYIASHDRDCDGTPLYSLAWKKGQRRVEGEYARLWNANLMHGWSDESLIIIKEA
jgi:hypothetical protein